MCLKRRKDFRRSLKTFKDSVFLTFKGREFHDFATLSKEIRKF